VTRSAGEGTTGGLRPLDATLALDLAGGGHVYRPTWGVRGRITEVGDTPVELPREEVREFEASRLALRGRCLGNAPDQAEARPADAPAGEDLPPQALLERARLLGTRLFDSLFRGSIRIAYARAYAEARESYTGLRLRFQLHENLQNLPFELLYDPIHGLFLAANTFTSLVRGTLGTAVSLPTVDYPLRLLVVVANPKGMTPLDTEAELRLLGEGLGKLSELRIWDMEVVRGPDTLHQLQFHADKSRFHVLHYIGHGWADSGLGGNGLVLEDAQGRCDLAAPHELNSVLAGYHNLRLVVLNCCHGADQLEDRPFGSIAHWLLKLDIAAVVAMGREIDDRSALVFTDYLYRGVANCRPIDEAVTLARVSLARARDRASACDWFKPQLFLRSEEGTLFSTRDGRKACEYLAETALADDDVNRALTVCERAGDWEAALGQGPDGRFTRLLRRVGELAARQGQWESLGNLVRLCESRGLHSMLPLRAWARAVGNRRRWQDEMLAGLRQGLTSGDPVRAGRALAECDRLLGLFSRDQATQQSELYEGDPDLWRAFWPEDFSAVRDLRGQYAGPILPPAVLHLAEVLARLAEQGGVLAALPARWWKTASESPYAVLAETGVRPASMHEEIARLVPATADERLRLAWDSLTDPALRLEADLFVHPLHHPPALLSARQRLLDEGERLGDQGSARLVEWLAPILGEDTATVLLALDMPGRAIELWEREVLSAPDPTRMLALHHHLALASLPAAGQDWDESRLAPWAVLLADKGGPGNYWEAWCGQREAVHGRPLPPEAREAVPARLQAWLDEELSDPSRPGVPTPLGRWFRAERAVAQILGRLRHGPLARLPLAGGIGMARRLKLAPALETIYGQLTSRSPEGEAAPVASSRPEFDALFELRSLFSSHAAAWLTVHGESEPEAALECLRDLACPACRARAPAADALTGFLWRLPESWRPTLCRPGCPEFTARNPLYAALPKGYRLYLDDVRRLTLSVLLELARRRLQEEGGVQEFADLLAAAATLGGGWPETDRQLHDLQRIAVDQMASLDQEGPLVAIASALDVLECLAQFGPPDTMRAALTQGYLMLARVLVEDEPSRARDCAVKALQWSEDSLDARAVVCLFIVREARRLASLGESAAARACLQEFRQVADAAERMTAELLKLKDEADELAGELVGERTQAPVAPDELPAGDEWLWQECAEAAEQAMRGGNPNLALECLGDAVVLAPREPTIENALVRLFLHLADVAEESRWREQVLQQARKHFPARPELQE
jgi:hypothetical protein